MGCGKIGGGMMAAVKRMGGQRKDDLGYRYRTMKKALSRA